MLGPTAAAVEPRGPDIIQKRPDANPTNNTTAAIASECCRPALPVAAGGIVPLRKPLECEISRAARFIQHISSGATIAAGREPAEPAEPAEPVEPDEPVNLRT